MPNVSRDVLLRYGLAILSVALAGLTRWALNPILGNHYVFFLFFVAIVFAAGYGGYGPAVLALVLSWLSADYLFLSSGDQRPLFDSKFQLAFAFVAAGLVVAVLGGTLRAARQRATANSSDLQRAFETQKAEREWLQITLASITDAVITTNPNGLVISLNPVAGRLTGWSVHEALGQPLREVFRLVQETSWKTDDLPIAKVVDGGNAIQSNDEAVLIARNGKARSVEHSAAPIRDAAGKIKGVAIIFRDVTERHRVEKAQRESEERFHQLADHIDEVFWIYEFASSKISYVSPAYESTWGRSCQSLYERPMSYLEALCPADRERAMLAHRSRESGKITAEEYLITRPDGTRRWIWDRGYPIRDESGRVVRVAGIAEDITERKRVEQALREGEERFRTLADATPVLIWGSGTDKLCNYFNKQWFDFTGRSAEEEMGVGWTRAVHSEDRDRCMQTYHEAFDLRQPFTMEYRLRRHDGDYRWVVDTGVPRFTPDGTFSGYIGSCFDISDQKRVEEELRQSDRRKEEFLAVLSHELRNPLAPIQTAVDVLEQAGMSKAGSERHLAMIKRQVGNLKRLVDDLLDISRISRGKIELRKELIELAPVVGQAVEAVRPLFDDNEQEVRASIPSESILLEADATRLEQILVNLLINTAKYTPRGGRIWLDVERLHDEVVIRVKDTGIGIEPDLLPTVFDLFSQGERWVGRSHEGGGIGLSLAKNLVELHGGTITAHSQGVDLGSEFVIKFPIAVKPQGERQQTAPLSRLETSDVPPRRRILIVDDNVQAADSLGVLLSAFLGQDVRVAYRGDAALDVARSFRPQVVLLDLEMPGMDGYEVATRLRMQTEFSDLVIVALTGWGHEEHRQRSREIGFDVHMIKPVTAKDLRGMLLELAPMTEKRSLAKPEIVCQTS
jgi:PAS domain S-box-containing protein